ncbi:hypothetical protein OSB04_022319 [Centaurea solstitialis]|uniref:non-specific serine/threonine protein kinase n=1 Tax=Centaurea solstitialis TaxID=347529 RepID=A0AA38T765_9ASTR|nr:hypothetical protein OSB04_022319 [Centaurea solstitialis]
MRSIETLDLSHNDLSGRIPQSLVNLTFLSKFSVAYNNLQGSVPDGGQFPTFPNTSFEGNQGLSCGGGHTNCERTRIPQFTTRKSEKNIGKIVGMAVGICLGTVFILALMFMVVVRATGRQEVDPEREDLDDDYDSNKKHFDELDSKLVLFHNEKELSIDDLLKSTNSFDQANIIGCGGFGLVFKATLPDNQKVAIKKLSGDGGQVDREFQAEVETLSRAQHPNLVLLQGYCKHKNDRLLITLEQHPSRRALRSPFGRFGLARLILPYDTHVTTDLVGTLGYIPPEYGQASVASFKGDVYSFGVVLLELITGKRPMDMCKPKGSRDLISWVLQMKNEKRENEVIDSLMFNKEDVKEMQLVIGIACVCLNESPKLRPSTSELVSWLDSVGKQ